MKHQGNKFYYTATDLVGFLNCEALTAFDRLVANGKAQAPKVWNPMLEVLWQRGLEHERQYVEHLSSLGLEVTLIEGKEVTTEAISQTLRAAQSGADVIVQAALAQGAWVGRADVLLRVDGRSSFGDWVYHPVDTKLSRETKAGSVLQLCLYADLLEQMQGNAPETLSIVPPWRNFEPEQYRYHDYAAYFRQVRHAFEAHLSNNVDAPYPEPVAHCDICRWRNSCDQRRRADDHLSLVANLSKRQAAELEAHGVTTLAQLAALQLPLPFKPARGSAQALEKAREQARVQLQTRESGENVFELLPFEAGSGLAKLPEPDSGDIFLDFEGDPFVGEHGLEYLTGYVARDADGQWRHHASWAFNRQEERTAFEGFVDFVVARLETHPRLHIYHYAPYEPSALKRLMGRYGSREDEIDRMLRAEIFVDLLSVVRGGLRAGVESYSIKKLEPLFGYVREKPMDEANLALARLQSDLELGTAQDITSEVRADVEAYNKDDCLATLYLRDWLEDLRAQAISDGAVIDRPIASDGEASDNLTDWIIRISALMERLTGDVPDESDERSIEQAARWLLANTLDFHRREDKAVWWEFFRLADLPAEELLDERAGLSDLEFESTIGGTAAAPIHRYRFPPQETDIRDEDDLMRDGGDKFGKVVENSNEQGFVDIKKRRDTSALHAPAVFRHKVVNARVLADALVRIGEFVSANGIEGEGEFQSARDLLLRRRPRGVEHLSPRDNETSLDAAKRIVREITSGVLPIQGPPGAGKTYTGSRMVCELVRQGKTVGVTANSHKVIRNFLDGVIEAAEEEGLGLQAIQKVSNATASQGSLSFTTDNAQMSASLAANVQVGGATAWYWARQDVLNSVDVLFVDEAAQMSLANVLAVSGAAKTLVLLGDPQQLDQPVQGSHPDGTDVSALAHILMGEETIQPDQGLFLDETWRLHPRICAFTSELFYGEALHARDHNARQTLTTSSEISGAGLWYLPVEHTGNINVSTEEAQAIERLVSEILDGNPTWTDRNGSSRPLTDDDILVITPYNAQVFEIQQRLPNIRVGTVDKFQGQEAPIAIYSTATSTQADAPRGMEFLYNLNRFNVATSRAKCASILMSCPSLLEAECRTPQQMRLANAFCRFKELATLVVLD